MKFLRYPSIINHYREEEIEGRITRLSTIDGKLDLMFNHLLEGLQC